MSRQVDRMLLAQFSKPAPPPDPLPGMIAEEFKLLHFRATRATCAKVAAAMRSLEVEFGEIEVSFACVGYIAASVRS